MEATDCWGGQAMESPGTGAGGEQASFLLKREMLKREMQKREMQKCKWLDNKKGA